MTEVTAPWYTGVEGYTPELVGHIQSKGWDKLDAPKAALELTKAWKEAEKFVGVPANQIIRVPTDVNDAAGWKTLWQRLGAPADAKDYDFTTSKLDAATQEVLRSTAAAANLPKDAATAVAAALAKHAETADAAKVADYTAKVEGERATLAKNWGANHAANMIVAKGAAAALGMTPEEIGALEKTVGYARTFEMLRNVGSKIGEDKFITSGGAGGNGIMTKEQAVAKLADLKKDESFVKRYMTGDTAAAREMAQLHTLIHG